MVCVKEGGCRLCHLCTGGVGVVGVVGLLVTPVEDTPCNTAPCRFITGGPTHVCQNHRHYSARPRVPKSGNKTFLLRLSQKLTLSQISLSYPGRVQPKHGD